MELTPYSPESETSQPDIVELIAACESLVDTEDIEYLEDVDDFSDGLNYVYGRLVELGYDADEVLSRAGIIED